MFAIKGQPVFQEQRTDTILNPCLIIEVLLSTKNYDYTDKFRYYRSILGFQEYLLINQYEIAIEHYTKAEGGSWLFRAYESDAGKIAFTSVDVEMTMTDIYEGVDFSLNDGEQ